MAAPCDHYDGSDRFRKSRELVRHAVNQAQLASQGFVATAAVSIDVGDVAVIVDNGSILIPPRPANPFDLTVPPGLNFDPGVDKFTVSATTTALDGTFGVDLMLGDERHFFLCEALEMFERVKAGLDRVVGQSVRMAGVDADQAARCSYQLQGVAQFAAGIIDLLLEAPGIWLSRFNVTFLTST